MMCKRYAGLLTDRHSLAFEHLRPPLWAPLAPYGPSIIEVAAAKGKNGLKSVIFFVSLALPKPWG
jgi:hypothetical protein